MQKLPVEVVDAIVSEAALADDLITLREVDTLFHKLVTPKIFRHCQIRNSVKSAAALEKIRECERLVNLVKKVSLDPRGVDEPFEVDNQTNGMSAIIYIP